MKWYIKVGITILALVVLLTLGITYFIHQYKNELIEKSVTAINATLVQPIQLDTVEVTFWKHFPNIEIQLSGVRIPKSNSDTRMLASIGSLVVRIKTIPFVFKKIEVAKVTLQRADFHLTIDKEGTSDFAIFKKRSTPKDSIAKTVLPDVAFDKIVVEEVHFIFLDAFKPKQIDTYIAKGNLSLHINKDSITGDWRSKTRINQFQLKPGSFLTQALVDVQTHFNYNLFQPSLDLNSVKIIDEKNAILGSMHFEFGQHPNLNLNLQSKQSDIVSLLNWLPRKWTKFMDSISLEGKMTFTTSIQTSLRQGSQPKVKVSFQLKEAKIKPLAFQLPLQDVELMGELQNDSSGRIESFELNIKKLTAQFGKTGKLLSSNCHVKNFKEPYIQLSTQLTSDLNDLFLFTHLKEYKQAKGLVKVHLTYDGDVSYWMKQKVGKGVFGGSIQFSNVLFQLKNMQQPVENMNGQLLIGDRQVVLKNIQIKKGSSDITLNGTCKNLYRSIYKNIPGLEVQLSGYSNELTWTDFVSPSGKSKKDSNQSVPLQHLIQWNKDSLQMPYGLTGTIDLYFKKIKAYRFNASDLSIRLKVTPQKIDLVESMKTMKGSIAITSLIQPQKQFLKYQTQMTFKHVVLPELFKAFNSFKQKIITPDNILGRMSGNYSFVFYMNHKLEIDTSLFSGKGSCTIKGLVLKNVEPLVKAGQFVPGKRDFSNVTSEEIKNSLRMSGNTIYIDRTLIHTNIAVIYIEGKLPLKGIATFDLRIPIKNLVGFKSKDVVLTNDSKAGISIPVHIEGQPGKMSGTSKPTK